MSNKDKNFMQNRELSWLRFNERVLDEADDEGVPLYERLKFISIFTSNCDEFFRVRVGSLYDMSLTDKKWVDNKTGMTAQEQLQEIYATVRPLYKKRDMLFVNIRRRLKDEGVKDLQIKELRDDEITYIKEYYDNYIASILSPQIVDEHHPFPFLPNKQSCIVAELIGKKKRVLGLIPIPETVQQILFLPGKEIRYIHLETILLEATEKIFGEYKVKDKNLICITRNADINPDSDANELDGDFRNKMKKLIKKRNRLAPVRLECKYRLNEYIRATLCNNLELKNHQLFIVEAPFKLVYVFSLVERFTTSMKRYLCYDPFSPQPIKAPEEKGRDVLYFYPFESMNPFLNLLKKSSNDSSVLSIKITIYRVARNAKIIDYLCNAAEQGKEVIVLIELRARFDEQNNIDWSERLEKAGCRVIYGFEDYKVHSKVCLITKREKGKIKYITQIGTGNYNEKTSEQYTDLSLITENQEIGADANELFLNMAIGNLDGNYKHLLVAPNSMKSVIIEKIEKEKEKGAQGRIVIKVNSVSDLGIIKELQMASEAGVDIRMVVRGICCILPGVEGVTDNIKIMSIVGRFLEHSRIYSFGQGEEQEIYISSADLMTRNMQRRVEVACPIYDEEVKAKINHIMDVVFTDSVKGRRILPDGSLELRDKRLQPVDSQKTFMREAIDNRYEDVDMPDKFFYRVYKNIITKLYKRIEERG